MLSDEDRIFKNLYNDFGWDVESAVARGDWSQTKELISKGKDWIVKEVKEDNKKLAEQINDLEKKVRRIQ